MADLYQEFLTSEDVLKLEKTLLSTFMEDDYL